MRVNRHLVAACLAAVTLLACEGGGGPDAAGASPVPDSTAGSRPLTGEGSPSPDPERAPAIDALCTGLSSASGALASRLGNAPISQTDSGNYRPASPSEQSSFEAALQGALRGEPVALAGFQALGFQTSCYTDGGGTRWLLIEDATPGRSGGRVALNLAPARDLWFEAPHPASDENSEYLAVDLAAQLGARAVVLSGSHRCTSPVQTACSGSSSPCGTVRISDVAHDTDNFFNAAHRALRASFGAALAVSVHGMSPLADEAAVISDGTEDPRPGSISVKLRDAINRELRSASRAASSNDPSDSGYRKECGRTNVQGRHDNGSPNACTVEAPRASDRFIHLEQSPALRGTAFQEGVGPEAVTRAFAALVPCTAGGKGLGCAAVAAR